MSENEDQEINSDDVCKYVHNKNVKTPFLETPDTEDHKPTQLWLSQILDYLDPKMFERLVKSEHISKDRTVIDLIRRDLEPLHPGEKTRVEELMDFVVAFKDKEVECNKLKDNLCEGGNGHVDPEEVGAGDCCTCQVCAGDVGAKKIIQGPRVEDLVDYVVAFKDRKVQPASNQQHDNACEVGNGHVDPGEVCAGVRGTYRVSAGDAGTKKNGQVDPEENGAGDCCTCQVCAGDAGTKKNVQDLNWFVQIGRCKDLGNRLRRLEITPDNNDANQNGKEDNTPIGSVISAISEPLIRSTYHLDEDQSSISDSAFCEYRLSGPNPTSIKLCSSIYYLQRLGIDINSEMLDLLKNNRLFVVDYSLFADLPRSEYPDQLDLPPKYTYGSIALFKSVKNSSESSVSNGNLGDTVDGNRIVAKSHLEPICIQIIGHSKQKKVFYPSPNNSKDVGWKIAKCIFQSNDGLHHEAFAHLTCTHLVMEACMVATYRCLPTEHPLFALLVKHFDSTAYMNEYGVNKAVEDGGILSILFSSNMSQVRDLMSKHFERFTSKNLTFPARIAARGMNKCVELNYPYRDDGMLLWNAILKWVKGYLLVFYKTQNELLKDKDVQNWLKELSSEDGGRIKWTNPEKFNCTNAKKRLSKVVASIIFIASVEHAAVNNPQRTIMQFTGVYPLSIHAGEAVVFRNNPTEADYMSLYPTIQMARMQAAVMQLSGSVRHPLLGWNYNDFPILEELVDEAPFLIGLRLSAKFYFRSEIDDEYVNRGGVIFSWQKFFDELYNIEKEIERRNKRRKFKYVEMLPSRIPSSCNI